MNKQAVNNYARSLIELGKMAQAGYTASPKTLYHTLNPIHKMITDTAFWAQGDEKVMAVLHKIDDQMDKNIQRLQEHDMDDETPILLEPYVENIASLGKELKAATKAVNKYYPVKSKIDEHDAHFKNLVDAMNFYNGLGVDDLSVWSPQTKALLKRVTQVVTLAVDAVGDLGFVMKGKP